MINLHESMVPGRDRTRDSCGNWSYDILICQDSIVLNHTHSINHPAHEILLLVIYMYTRCECLDKEVSMTRKCNNHTMHINPRNCEEEPQNTNSYTQELNAKLERTCRTALLRRPNTKPPQTSGVTINIQSTATELPP